MSVTVIAHESTHENTPSSSPTPQPPSPLLLAPGPPCSRETDESAAGARLLVPSDQLPLMFCPAAAARPSPPTGPHPQKGSRLRFENESCRAGGCVPLSRKDNKETQEHPTVTLTCFTGDPESLQQSLNQVQTQFQAPSR
ncbi:unnamed protein product [Pleuronectes platessa]|uniref:Uncharacterized protein n=1 Tax=Pleuronectes platessa TaxID=8262 RepID=A0A9N7VFT2_PLEPL|nr:unnamed protein product [Pleuronectes platessa]